MTCKLFVAFEGGIEVEEERPNHELGDIQTACECATKELYVAIELTDQSDSLIFTYRRKTTYAY